MIKNTITTILLFLGCLSYGQVVINEMDTDTPSTDDKEFIEIKSDTPYFPLDAYVLVMFNGSTTASNANKSYYAVNLDGFSTDTNGLFLFGNPFVSPVPEKLMPISTIQNGPDAIAIYLGSTSDFPNDTMATSTNLIDALAYGTSAVEPTALMTLLNLSVHVNENMNSLGTSQSIQRKPDGTYEVKTPTPGANNDGSGILFNGITISVPATTYNEGDNFDITFTTQYPVESNLSFNFTLDSGSLDLADFTGNLNVFIPTGGTTFSTNILLIDDVVDDTDELGTIKFGTLPVGYVRLNDLIEFRVIDNDFTTSAWGTPINPTYGVVSSTAPSGYYATLEGKSGAVLKQAIQDIIANPAVVHAQNYGDIEYMLKDADQNPLNSNEVWLMYLEEGRAKYKFQTTSSNIGSWNREHIYPQSRGGFANATDSNSDGINNWLPTNADDIATGHADGHHLRAEDGPENTRRSNKDYGLDDYVGPLAGTQGSWHGDVARSLFYMSCRYNLLSVVNGNLPDSTPYQIGDLATLLVWNHSDPSDDFEMNRNNIIYNWQINRNPFIDYPDLADYLWGVNAGEAWFAPLKTQDFSGLQVVVYPNPTHDNITISGLENGTIAIYGVSGIRLMETTFIGNTTLSLNLASGIYFAQISADGKSTVKKLIVR